MTTSRRSEGLQEIAADTYAYLQKSGSWLSSNAGLIVDGDQSLLIDTLFDLPRTRQMLESMARVPGGADIQTLVNTHANSDHCWGNQLVSDAEIIASKAAAEDLPDLSPREVVMLLEVAGWLRRLGPIGRGIGKLCAAVGIRRIAAIAEGSEFVDSVFRDFDPRGVQLTLPSRTFEGELELMLGDTKVQLFEVGPAHTRGDVVVVVPTRRVVYTGDILFNGYTPIVWEGPVSNWLAACDRLLSLDIDTVVPGHGPLAGKQQLRDAKEYLERLFGEVKARYDAGLSAREAAYDIDLDALGGLPDAERIIINTETIYRELSGSGGEPDFVQLFAAMGRFVRARGIRVGD